MTDTDDADAEPRLDAHLRDIDDGCGCTEVWEHTSAARAGEQSADGGAEGNASAAADADVEADANVEADASDVDDADGVDESEPIAD